MHDICQQRIRDKLLLYNMFMTQRLQDLHQYGALGFRLALY